MSCTITPQGEPIGDFTISEIVHDCVLRNGSPDPHLVKFTATFKQKCPHNAGGLTGTFAYSAPVGVTCASLTGGGTGDGSGTGGTPTPQPPPPGPTVVLSDNIRATPIAMTNSMSSSVLFSVATPAGASTPVTLSAVSDADDLIASISPSVIAAPGAGDAIIKLRTTPTTLAGDHVVTITASDGTTSSSASVFVTVLCDPPFILGIDQPKGSTVGLGRPAQLSVKASGSGPFTYQWFTGASGLSNFPLPGGTSANFTTSALNDTTSYWVRISNPCGSVNSQTATVNVAASAKPNSRR
ncbi:MAG TPA: hypothetical protein VII75_05395 [Thermoanaerobaculia bacterium]